jgi:2-oxoglutarate/2-oxoacid ferredoxin oxidoreductase subunit alpha
LRTPALILSDKEVGMTLESVDVCSLSAWPQINRKPFDPSHGRFRTYACDCPQEPPPFAPLGGPARVVATGSAHDRAGHLRKNADEVIELLAHLQTKISAHAEQMELFVEEPAANPEMLVLSYGISARAARAASRQLRATGRRVSFLQLLTLFPISAGVIRRAAQGCSHVVVVEENLTGLYASVLEPIVGPERLVRVNRIGRMITPGEIIAVAEAA